VTSGDAVHKFRLRVFALAGEIDNVRAASGHGVGPSTYVPLAPPDASLGPRDPASPRAPGPSGRDPPLAQRDVAGELAARAWRPSPRITAQSSRAPSLRSSGGLRSPTATSSPDASSPTTAWNDSTRPSSRSAGSQRSPITSCPGSADCVWSCATTCVTTTPIGRIRAG